MTYPCQFHALEAEKLTYCWSVNIYAFAMTFSRKLRLNIAWLSLYFGWLWSGIKVKVRKSQKKVTQCLFIPCLLFELETQSWYLNVGKYMVFNDMSLNFIRNVYFSWESEVKGNYPQFFGNFSLLKILMQSYSVNRRDNLLILCICAVMYNVNLLLRYEWPWAKVKVMARSWNC